MRRSPARPRVGYLLPPAPGGHGWHQHLQLGADGALRRRRPHSCLDVYPNPASQPVPPVWTCRAPSAGTYQVSIVDMTGRVLRTLLASGRQQRALDITSLPAGTYLVQVKGNGQSFTKRLSSSNHRLIVLINECPLPTGEGHFAFGSTADGCDPTSRPLSRYRHFRFYSPTAFRCQHIPPLPLTSPILSLCLLAPRTRPRSYRYRCRHYRGRQCRAERRAGAGPLPAPGAGARWRRAPQRPFAGRAGLL